MENKTINNPTSQPFIECSLPTELVAHLSYLGIIKDPNDDTRNYNIGTSNYSTHVIQPWSIWLDYLELTSWDHDIIKRVLRTKDEPGMNVMDARILDYKKIIHDCHERIRQLNIKASCF